MRLSDLIRLKNNLKSINLDSVRQQAEVLDGQLSQLFTITMHMSYRDQLDEKIKDCDMIENALVGIESKIQELLKQIDAEVSEITKDYMARGYMVNGFYGSNYTDVPTERNDRLLPINDETRSEVVVRLRSYTDWHYPVLEIGPGDGTWTEHLVAGDPLYILERHQEFIDNTLNKFNGVYRNRIRPYLTGMHGRTQEEDMSMLPENQFGFIFSWNVFNYMPLKETIAMLQGSYQCLRPGGVMMFSYNNCDVAQCAEYVEQGFRSWMPSMLLEQTCKDLGFEIIANRSIEETVHWIEIRKPGALTTTKYHQVLGKIINAST
jgi:phospholipid N-methyltransferase